MPLANGKRGNTNELFFPLDGALPIMTAGNTNELFPAGILRRNINARGLL